VRRFAIIFLAVILAGCDPPASPKVSVWERFKSENGKPCLVGALQNNSSGTLNYVEVYCSFFDSHTNKIATAQGKLGNIPSGGVRVFKIPADVAGVAICNVDNVTADQWQCDLTVKSIH
jgi:hypothetical protein